MYFSKEILWLKASPVKRGSSAAEVGCAARAQPAAG